MSTINQRISTLRNWMQHKNIQAVILPSNDPHQSEYVSDHWKIRPYFSGFTGSAGTFVVTTSQSAIWTDARYFLQVEDECGHTEVQLCKQKVPHAPEHVDWLCDLLTEGNRIGVDYRLFSLGQMEHLQMKASSKNIQIVDIAGMANDLWPDRPAGGTAEIVEHPIEFAGESTESKLGRVRSWLSEKAADYLLITRLDEIAWLYNLRSTDIECTPLAMSYAIVGQNESILYIDMHRVSDQLNSNLAAASVSLQSYESFFDALHHLSANKKMLVDKTATSYACINAITGDISYALSPIQEMKSIKNEQELANARKAMVLDGIALTRFFMWTESHLKNNTISEYALGRKLDEFRQQESTYQYESFSCICGYKGNGAIIHYRAPKEGSATISNDGILLLDSGGQYLFGTTDITRTVWLGGEVPASLKRVNTLVLKGHMNLSRAIFPDNTIGAQLDALARKPLWTDGLNFGHGTGHGIGCYAMVHEGPQGFAFNVNSQRGATTHQVNQLTTIEPGHYKTNEYGIRIENVVVSKEHSVTEDGRFLCFEPITLFPIDTQLIDLQLLSDEEIQWLNDYHQMVYDKLADHLNAEEKAWMAEKCQAV
jgi:Xaa-Pro aminopeptidase